ncbi:MAG: 2-C-methyl-D-erythritol 4-phosphate cytidylyltransferase [Endomicrobiales bacterium]
MKAAAIIVAAGASRRFGSPVPKQFLPLSGKPVFLWSVLAFKKVREFGQIILVVPENMVSPLERHARRYRFELVAGGRERFDSVRAGLEKLRPGTRYVAIHDGARPLVAPELLRRALSGARKTGAAAAAVPARDTVKISARGARVDRTIPRERVWLAQTPQVFSLPVILGAYGRRGLRRVTDDAQAAEIAGNRVSIVPGDYSNIKITDRADLEVARLLMHKRKKCA